MRSVAPTCSCGLDLPHALPLNRASRGEKRLSRLCVCGRVTLQLLDYVPAFLQQRDHAARSGEMKRARDNRGGFAGLQFRLDSRDPFHVAVIDETRRNAWRL